MIPFLKPTDCRRWGASIRPQLKHSLMPTPTLPFRGDRRCWVHGILTTYGAWLDGDDRGFRTYKHKLHVEGDYKHRPPTGRYKHRKERSQELLKQPPVTLPRKVRKTVGIALIDRLHKSDAFVLAVAVGGQHIHLLAKLPAGDARHWFGLAKKHATFEMRHSGWVGELWGHRANIVRIKSRRHQLNVYRYILDHSDEGAWIWDWRIEGRARD